MADLGITYKEHETYLEIVVAGTYDLQNAINTIPAALSACRRLGLSSVLVDYRDLEEAGSVAQKMLFTHGVVDQHRAYVASGGEPVRVAYLGVPANVTSYQPGVEISRQNGMEIAIFTNEAEARSWLGV